MDIRLLGGAPALDFVNTVDPLVGPDAVDGVASPALLSAWGVHAGITAQPVAVRQDDLERARSVREALTRIFVAIAAGDRPRPATWRRSPMRTRRPSATPGWLPPTAATASWRRAGSTRSCCRCWSQRATC